jgi:hypothetical protein
VGDDARARILERRAAFVAAAISAVAADGCSKPRVCLDVTKEEIVADDAVAKPAPSPSQATTTGLPEVTDQPDAGAPEVHAIPVACLSYKPPPKRVDAGPPPAPCLKVAPPDDF